MKFKILLSLVFLAFLFFIVLKAFAAQNFLISFDVTYTVSDSGMTHAVFKGILQNTSDAFYASSYTLQTGFDAIQNVNASDSQGAINPEIKTSDRGNSVFLRFNAKAIGKNVALPFTFSFDTPNVAKKVGNIWEINIPGISNPSEFNNFTIHLVVPRDFGAPTYVKPVNAGNTLNFTKDVLGSSGISLAFGQQQTYNFILKYHLKNSQLFPIKSEVALPPTTDYQDVFIKSIKPTPQNVSIDTDGNWLAQYSLLPSQELEVVVDGTANLNWQPFRETLSAEKRKIYLKPTEFWQQTGEIKKLARELQTPRNIYDFVVSHLHYDFSRVVGVQERLGASKVLEDPQSAVCLEFTDLFIALARSAGIPAREVNGYAYTQNSKERPLSLVKDVLHAWPEYYDDSTQSWIMIDPTWANTTRGVDYFNTLDFDHFAFVVKGVSSDNPVPAGGYKLSGTEKDVFVTFGQEAEEPSPVVSLDFKADPINFSGSEVSGNLIIKNEGDSLVPPQYITVSAAELNPPQQALLSSFIAPYGQVEIPVKFKKPYFLTNFNQTIKIAVGEKTVTKQIAVYPFFLQFKFILGGVLIVILCIFIFVAAPRLGRLQIFKRKP